MAEILKRGQRSTRGAVKRSFEVRTSHILLTHIMSPSDSLCVLTSCSQALQASDAARVVGVRAAISSICRSPDTSEEEEEGPDSEGEDEEVSFSRVLGSTLSRVSLFKGPRPSLKVRSQLLTPSVHSTELIFHYVAGLSAETGLPLPSPSRRVHARLSCEHGRSPMAQLIIQHRSATEHHLGRLLIGRRDGSTEASSLAIAPDLHSVPLPGPPRYRLSSILTPIHAATNSILQILRISCPILPSLAFISVRSNPPSLPSRSSQLHPRVF